jgi:hypothetical protein
MLLLVLLLVLMGAQLELEPNGWTPMIGKLAGVLASASQGTALRLAPPPPAATISGEIRVESFLTYRNIPDSPPPPEPGVYLSSPQNALPPP